MSDLRELARQRYRENEYRQMRSIIRRRYLKAWAFGFVATIAVALAGVHLANVFKPTSDQIERGLR